MTTGSVRQVLPALIILHVRLQQRIPLGGRMSIDGIAEMFNVFDRPNWGIGTQESNTAQYRQRISAQTRSMQVGLRLQF